MADWADKITSQLKTTFDQNFYEKAAFIPSATETVDIFRSLRDFLYQYPLVCTPDKSHCLETLATRLEKQIQNALCFMCKEPADCKACAQKAALMTRQFLSCLPHVQKLVLSDVTAAYNGDPAAINSIEPLLCYPGITAMAYQRLAHQLHAQGVRLLPRIVTEYAHSITGIDIHPGAHIGPSFFIDHGTGVVIGETCVIGSHVKIYQGVTLGAKSFPLDENGNPVKGIKRHPNIEDNVIIYAETTVLGDITIGHDSVIGANKWITADVPPNSRV